MSVAGLDDPKLFKRILLMAATAKRSGLAVNEEMIGTAIRDGNQAALGGGEGAAAAAGAGGMYAPGAGAGAGIAQAQGTEALGRLNDIHSVLHRIADLLAGGGGDRAAEVVAQAHAQLESQV
jgi:hypothetical protein